MKIYSIKQLASASRHMQAENLAEMGYRMRLQPPTRQDRKWQRSLYQQDGCWSAPQFQELRRTKTIRVAELYHCHLCGRDCHFSVVVHVVTLQQQELVRWLPFSDSEFLRTNVSSRCCYFGWPCWIELSTAGRKLGQSDRWCVWSPRYSLLVIKFCR